MKDRLVARFAAAHGRAPQFLARAPGRIEFIGNHTDYNGGTVLGAAIDRSLWVAVAARTDGLRRLVSGMHDGLVTVTGDGPVRQTGEASWVNYPLGVVAALPEFGLRPPGGFDFFAMSDLPTGAGLSSSAALELASALALLALTGQEAPRERVVKLCRQAENHFVGVPCGILDQGVSGFGKKGHLVFIDCRGPRFAAVPLPRGAHFWIFNTQTKHALVDGLYAERHQECMAAARVLGLPLLADATVGKLEAARPRLAPTAYRRAKHIIEEIARVETCVTALKQGDLGAVGRLLTASHRSSQTLFENSTAELDFLVDTLATTRHVYGARLTGGGFGGAVMALTSAEFDETSAATVARAYAEKFNSALTVLHMQTGAGAQLV